MKLEADWKESSRLVACFFRALLENRSTARISTYFNVRIPNGMPYPESVYAGDWFGYEGIRHLNVFHIACGRSSAALS